MKTLTTLFFLLVTLIVGTASTVLGSNHNPQSSSSSSSSSNCTFTLIDLSSPQIEPNVSFSVVASAGLLNRDTASVYYYRVESDRSWLSTLVGAKCNGIATDPLRHLTNAVALIKNIILYDEKGAPSFLPSIATLAGLFDALPLEINLWLTLQRLDPASTKNAVIVFDARTAWSSAADAVSFTAQAQYLNKTTGFSFSSYSDLKYGGTADLIIHRRWFASYLNNSCVKGNSNHTIWQNALQSAPWPPATSGFGYNAQNPFLSPTHQVVAYPWEANTLCVDDPKKVAIGEVCTSGTFNMAFWSRWERETATSNLVNPARRAEPDPITYDSNKTYVSILIMDGDNLEFEQQFTRNRYANRVKYCQETPELCAPLSWTISPQMLDFMPSMLKYYYEQAAIVNDTMVMSPGGLMYSYPVMWSDSAQEAYVKQMNLAAQKMDIGQTSDWEWFYDVENAIEGNDAYYKKYVVTTQNQQQSSSLFRDVVKSSRSSRVSTFLVNTVPWPLNILLPFLSDGFSQVLGDDPTNTNTSVVVLRAVFNWAACAQGGGGWASTPAEVASILNDELPKGVVGYLYVTRNCDVSYIFEMVKTLQTMGGANHVELVHMNQLESLARQREVIKRQKHNK